MSKFKDNEGRQWEVAVNVTAVKRCRSLLGVDLPALVDDGFQGLAALMADTTKLMDVVYVLCKSQADARGLTDETFGEAIAGDVIGAAGDAFKEAFADFFSDPKVREALRKVFAKADAVRGHLLDRLAAEIDRIDPASEALKFTASSGGSPGNSASTPDPSPSPN